MPAYEFRPSAKASSRDVERGGDVSGEAFVCNLYNVTTTQQAIIQWTRAMRDVLGNLEPSIDIYPNYPAPVVRNAPDGVRELTKLQWGMPTPPERVKGKADYGTTNIRRPNYGHWRRWMDVPNRCVVPVTSFAEPSPTPGDKDPATGIQRNFWFAVDDANVIAPAQPSLF